MATSVKFNGKYKDWDGDILPIVKDRLSTFRKEGVTPTVRGLLYIFESMKVLRKKDYGSLSKHLVKWREQEIIPPECVVDKTRRIIDINHYIWKGERVLVNFDENLQIYEQMVTTEDHIRNGINYLRDTIKDFHGNVPRWLNQKHYVEVWLEKNAIAGTFNSILNGGDNPRRIVIAPNGGWSSFTFAYDNIHRLLDQQKVGKTVHIRYYGDSDPSGDRMDDSYSKMVNILHKHGIDFERIAITDQTIEDFNLEHLKEITDIEVLAKLERNPNYDYFTKKHDGQVWQIELDALQLDPKKFKGLVLSDVDQFWNEDTYQEALEDVKQSYPPAGIHRQLKAMITQLSEELEDRDGEYEVV